MYLNEGLMVLLKDGMWDVSKSSWGGPEHTSHVDMAGGWPKLLLPKWGNSYVGTPYDNEDHNAGTCIASNLGKHPGRCAAKRSMAICERL